MATRISKTAALKKMQESKGKFFSVTFVKEDKSTRTMNVQYDKKLELSPLGFIRLKDRGDNNQIKNVNLQTIKELKINKETFKVK